MKINDLQVDGFGVWKGLYAESLSANLTVFYGQNEAGKTTLMQFVRSTLFGFSADRREKYVPPVYGGLAGGSLFVTAPSGAFEIQRHVDPNRHADPAGDLTLIDSATGDVHGAVQLANVLSNIDESIYNNVFAVGLREIQELNALNNTQAADHLYRLTSGLDRVSLIDVMRDTSKCRAAIWSDEPAGNAAASRLATLYRKRATLTREIEDLRVRSRRWTRIAAQARDAQIRLESIEKQIKELERDSRMAELALQIFERWSKREGLTAQIDSFGTLPDPRDISVDNLNELNSRIERHREKINQLRQQRRKLRKDADKIGVNRLVWEQRNRIEALVSHAPWIESLQKNANAVSAEVDSINAAMASEVEGLGGQVKLKGREIEQVATRNFTSLKSLAKEIGENQEKVNRLKDEAEKWRFEVTQHEKTLGGSLAEATGNIPESMEDASRNVNRLRRRIELEEKIAKLQRNHSDLEREVDEVVEEQVLPPGKLAIVGGVFVVGCVLGLLGMLYMMFPGEFSLRLSRTMESITSLGITMMLMGTVFGLISLAVRYHWERTAREHLEDFRHQMEMVRQQLKRSKAERDEIDRLMPGASGQHELNLKDAELRLGRLEELVPMENRAKSARSRLEEIRRMISSQERELEGCEKKWQFALRTVGLPETLAPAQVREISLRSGRITGFNTRLDTLRSELALREKELSDVAVRIEELARDTGLQMTVSRRKPLDGLTLLTGALGEQRQLMIQRKELKGQYGKMRSQQTRLTRELDALLGQHTRLMSSVGVQTEDEYRQFDLKHSQRNELIGKRNQLTEQIAAALGKSATEAQIRPMLEGQGQSSLERRWDTLGTEIEVLKKEHATLLQQRGELLQEIRNLGEDNKLELANLDLNSVEQEISDLHHEWQVLATTSQMLEAIREGYESKRQPETLREASGYLAELTDGAYTRIWTRMTGEELLVDNREEGTITVDKLSRGTREAVYLSLRLALVGVYARRGAVLPLILDDILVNFDAHRARKAAEVLHKFSANGYQILMFTCHDHMRDMFHELHADVRILPSHKDVFENQARPWAWNPDAPAETGMPEPVPAVHSIRESERTTAPAVRVVAALPMKMDEFDDELAFELSEIAKDQNRSDGKAPLRAHMVYRDSRYDGVINLPEDENIWLDSKGNRQTA